MRTTTSDAGHAFRLDDNGDPPDEAEHGSEMA